jgi:hypothetical protein
MRRETPNPEGSDASRRQLDRQCNSVEPAADIGDNRRICVAQLELIQARRDALDEELDGRKAQRLGCSERRQYRRVRQRRQPVQLLALDAKRFAAGRQDMHA